MRYSALFLLGLLVACGPAVSGGDDDDDGIDAGNGWPDGREGPDEFADARPARQCTKMDIVFVVDDSGSMVEEQTNLASNFPLFASILDTYTTSGGDLLDYRLAVTTTGRDVDYTVEPIPGFGVPMSEDGDNGVFRQDCGMGRRWLERGDTDVEGTFSCAAQVGTGGPSLEMPLHTLELALDDRVADGTNSGFLREDALLAFVVLTDEDDCSREDDNFTVMTDACDSGQPEIMPITHYLDFLDSLKGERGRWATAVIAGPGPSTCTSDFGDALYAQRLQQFVTQTGDNAVFSSICEGDLASALTAALDTFEAACDAFPPID